MEDERRRVLDMLDQGTISAEEAASLIKALAEADSPVDDAGGGAEDTARVPSEQGFPEVSGLHHYWEIPFVIALTITGLLGFWLSRVSGSGSVFGQVCLSVVFGLSVLVTLAALWTAWTPWIHIRLLAADGGRVAISLPAPLNLARWGIRLARGFVQGENVEYLGMAEEALAQLSPEKGVFSRDPLVIYVDDDEDGDRVAIYIG